MNKFNSLKVFFSHWRNQIVDPIKVSVNIQKFISYLRDMKKYSKIKGSEPIKLKDTYPCLHDKTKISRFDSHYFYQDIWAFKKILDSKFECHIDIGSNVNFIGFLSVIKKITFIDIRPLTAELDNFESKKGNILSLPFEDNSVMSISCLHVAEHIGLGRYGDQFDPFGTKKAARELSRVLAPNGYLYFSLPIGKPRLCFNAHRIHSTSQILSYFSDLELIELSGIDDKGHLVRNIESKKLNSCNYGCGLFWFTKK